MSSARELIAQLTLSFDEQDADLVGGDPLGFEGYPSQLERARERSGASEACVWGWTDIDDAACALVVLDFSFLGGSMGVAVGEKVARAFEAARERQLPVVTVTASGGARMQEGMSSLVQMAKTVEARSRHARAGLAHVALLTSPTTGGVYASFAALADVVYAEPGATIGFAGPRVVAELTGHDPAVHTSEFAEAHGLVDAIVTRGEEASVVGRALHSLTPRRSGPTPPGATGEPVEAASGPDPSAWERVQLARHPQRPGGRTIADALLVGGVELRGDRTGAPDDERVAVRVGGLVGSRMNAVVVAQDAGGDGRIRPQGFRKAIRAFELAGRLGTPVVTIVDTRGADPLPDSEAGGVAVAIARCLQTMLDCSSPTLTVVTGEGGSGGALAMAVADRVLCWEHAVFSVIAPEGAASILHRDGGRAAEVAEALKLTAPDLVGLDIVDAVVPEPAGGAHTAPSAAVADLVRRIVGEVEELCAKRPGARLRRRRKRWRSAGGSRG